MDNDKTPLLKVDRLRVYFGERKNLHRAVDGISFDITRGEVFGLVGESGCGKTTTGRAIMGIYPATAGDVYFKGRRISAGIKVYADSIKSARRVINCVSSRARDVISDSITINKKRIREAEKDGRGARVSLVSKIQMIFQDPTSSLDPRMTVGEIVAEGLVIKGERDREKINSRVYEVLELVGLSKEHAGRYPHEFSGGQKQRIGIARAIIMEPELIIADEPVSALDVSVQAQVINLLSDLRDSLNLTVLFIAHDLSVVKYFSDRIGVMYGGRIVELARAEELFKNPLHPYTRALLSAIPIPNPRLEKKRKRILYECDVAETLADARMREISPSHFVLCDEGEFKKYRGGISCEN